MKKLRDCGIYYLPGVERRLYAVPAGNDTYFLYDCELGLRLPPRFQILENGHLVNWFKDFPVWTIDDLIDSGETYTK